ncbi:MAG: hypothetical protein WAU70_15630, partial [Flavobacteriales bacterium]
IQDRERFNPFSALIERITQKVVAAPIPPLKIIVTITVEFLVEPSDDQLSVVYEHRVHTWTNNASPYWYHPLSQQLQTKASQGGGQKMS